MQEFVLIVISYLIGSIPTAVWVSRYFFGIDIRNYGSGNAGATNTFRILGKHWGSFVMFVDVMKGVLATSLYVFLPFYLHSEVDRTNLMIGLGLAAVAGHIYPVWAGFKGGKGVATLFGMAIAIQPEVAGSTVLVFILVLYATRFVSLSSMVAGVAFAVLVLYIFREQEIIYRGFAILVAFLLVFTHQKNIGRLLNGTESKVKLFTYRDKRRNQSTD